MKGIFVTAAAAMLTVAAQAEALIRDGNDLYEKCRDPARSEFCTGYVQGVLHGWQMMGGAALCPFGDPTLGQALDIVLQRLREAPETRDRMAPHLVTEALVSVWSCASPSD